MQLGVDLAIAGRPARFCPEARVWSDLPATRGAERSQRTRWEHGHLRALRTQVPRLLIAALRRGRPGLFGLALDLSVPPLSMLFLVWALALVGMLAWWAEGGSPLPAAVLAGGGAAAALAGFAAWARFGRDLLPAASLPAVPLYVLGKLPIYLSLLWKPQREWVRTERGAVPPAEGPPG